MAEHNKFSSALSSPQTQELNITAQVAQADSVNPRIKSSLATELFADDNSIASVPIEHIRNFSIIAHIDHGKSTLADRLIEKCGAVDPRKMEAQMLDSMDLEKERGITIKAQTVRLIYKARSGKQFILNLIDTPGHVDFSYEVSRSLAACEGSILVVDASQGVEAQTLANVYKAIENNHELVIALNKIDLPAAEPERVKEQIHEVIGLDASDAVPISAKTGLGVDELLEQIVIKLPAPYGRPEAPLKAMLVDSWYDSYLGVIVMIRVIDGVICKGMKVDMMATKGSYTIDNVGVFRPQKQMVESLGAGEVGFITASIKEVAHCRVGDTIIDSRYRGTIQALPGFKPAQSMVFCSLYPAEAGEFELLKESMSKLHLNDASFQFEVESSSALGFGFRCGFLGLLHLEIIQERLEREFGLNLITTVPSVVYRIHIRNSGEIIELHNPSCLPEINKIEFIEEPWVRASIIVPEEYVGAVFQLCSEKRGEQVDVSYGSNRLILTYLLPLNEIVYDFYDKLKSCSKGYASFDWEMDSYREGDLVKLNIIIHGEIAEALSTIVHKGKAEYRGREICVRLKDLIPRHLFDVPIQAAIGSRVIARETIKAMRKDVTAKCYGGDITRKRKLLEKQKEGKKKMDRLGKIRVPKSAFIAVLKVSDNKNKK